MRVLMIVDAAPPQYSGAGQQALLLARKLTDLGCDVQVVARRKENLDPTDKLVRFLGPYVRSERVSSLLFAVLVFLFVLKARIDVVHCHGAFYYGLSASIAARIRRIPFILKITLVGTDDPVSVRSRKAGWVRYGHIMCLQFKFASSVIAINSFIADTCRQSGDCSRIDEIPNGISLLELDLIRRARAEQEIGSGRRNAVDVTVSFTGEVCKRKGVDTLLQAWKLVLQRYPLAKLQLVGPINTELAVDIEEAGSSVVCFGMIPREQVVDLLIGSDVYVLPSRAEGSPNALIEAMALGLPSVTSDIPVCVAVAGSGAITADPEDAHAIERAIAYSIEYPAERSQAALDRSMTFDLDHIACRYYDIYQEVTKR